jgi:class 3 adenylate cyclase/tetratricopeptide (TPR) repeat protein
VIRCSACGSENPTGAKFCNECAAPLSLVCSHCGSANPPGAKFCSECASRLAATAVAAQQPDPAHDQGGSPIETPATPVAERRLVSVLFADLVGFTPFAEERDAEDVRETLTRYFDMARDTVERYGGTVEKFIGDAVMAVWGTPTTHEDDAERAVRAALELVAAVPALGSGTDARAAVLTGEATVTIGATHQGMVAGDLVNTAARLQSAAAPGTVLVGDATRRATEAAIAFEPVDDQALKGKATPVPAWRALRVVAAVGGRGRSESLEAPFVGRDDELRLMKELYHATRREGRPRLVSIIGPAGIGKSRLAWEFHKYLDGLAETMWTHDGRSPSYGDGISFWALGEMIRERARLAENDDEDTTRRGIADMLRAHVPDEGERRWLEPAMLALLGIGDSSVASEQLFAAWRTFFERMAETDPVVLVFEELHHADPGLLDFIDHLLDWSRSSPICIVTLARPELLEKRPDWGAGRRQFTSIYLEPLPASAMRELLGGLVPGLPEEAARTIVGRADGVPLYAVETVRMLVADGRVVERDGVYVPTQDITDIAIPDSLTGLIAARLDALTADQRAVLQDASVLGQSFTTAALAAVSGRPEASLGELLTGLVRREILTLRADPRSPERGQYAFVQALIREVAYNTLAKRDRKARHLAAARHFESLDTDELAGALARHYLAAHDSTADRAEAEALAAQARVALRAAAVRAVALGAPEQAFTLYEDAIRITTDDRERAELAFRGGEAASTAGKGEAADRLLAAARDGYEALGERIAALRATVAIGSNLIMRGRPADAKDVLLTAWEASADLADDPVRVQCAGQLARVHMYVDDSEAAVATADAMLGAAEHHDLVPVIADALVTKGTSLFNLGRVREARALILAGGELAESVGDHRSAVRARLNGSAVLDLDDSRASYESSLAGLALARRVGLRTLSNLLVGNAVVSAVMIGEWEWARAELERALGELDGTGRMYLLDPVVELASLRGDDRAAILDEQARFAAESQDPQFDGNVINSRAFDHFGSGRWGEAAREWLRVADFQDFGAADSLTWSAAAQILDRDLPGLRESLGRLKSLGQHGRLIDSTIRRTEAAIAALEGRPPDALGLLRNDLRLQNELGVRFGEGLVGLYMAWLLDLTTPEVRDAADRAREIFTALGAAPMLEWLDAAWSREPEPSAGWPAHRPSTEEVQVQVEDALP